MFRLLFSIFKKKRFSSFQSSWWKVSIGFISLFLYSTSGYLYFEITTKPDLTWLDAIWWTIVTMTTVGYGDFFPTTNYGRFLIALPVMILGIGFLGFIISEIAGKLIEARSKKIKGMSKMNAKNHILIINFSRIDRILSLIEEINSDLKTRGKAICLIDENLSELPAELLEHKISFVKGDPTSEYVLKKAGILKASSAIILAKDPSNQHSDDINLSTTLVIEKLRPEIFTIVEVLSPVKKHQVELAGADSIICVAELTNNLVCQELQDPGVKGIIEELTSNKFGQQLYIVSINGINSNSYSDLWNISNKQHTTLLGIVRNNKSILNPEFEKILEENDKAILIGDKRIKEINLN